jgi:hypothetical protein
MKPYHSSRGQRTQEIMDTGTGSDGKERFRSNCACPVSAYLLTNGLIDPLRISIQVQTWMVLFLKVSNAVAVQLWKEDYC